MSNKVIVLFVKFKVCFQDYTSYANFNLSLSLNYTYFILLIIVIIDPIYLIDITYI